MLDLEKYIDGFCFSAFYMTEDAENLFYLWEKDNSKSIHRLDLIHQDDLKLGVKIIDQDFSTRSIQIKHFDKKRKLIYLVLDSENKENFNLYRYDLDKNELLPLTQFNMVYGVTFNADGSICWCLSKNKKEDGTFLSEFHQIDLIKLTATLLVSDEGKDYRIGWTPLIQIEPEKETFIFTVDYLNQRKKTNICKYDLEKKEWELLLPADLEEAGNPNVCEQASVSEDFLFQSVHEGFENIYSFCFQNKKITKITDLENKSEEILITKKNGKSIVNVVSFENDCYFLKIYNPSKEKKIVKLQSLTYFFDTHKNFIGIQTSSDSTKKIISLDENGVQQYSIELTTCPSSELEHTKTTWVSYPSFDGKTIKGLLSLPKGELKGVAILAFYGGKDNYSYKNQIYAEQGIAIFSPAVRGSWGWGKDWEKMLEGDLGGNEILDVIWAAKYLEKKLNLTSKKIGVVGGSHGGFATLRAITMPNNFKNIPQTYYPFGFAVSYVGFADLIAFHRDSRIADWLVHLLGPFNEEKYNERSPLNFFENLNTPLLLINGKNDSRVPFSSIEKFINKLKESKKDYELLIHEKQGHGSSNRKTSLLELEVEVNFLKKYLF